MAIVKIERLDSNKVAVDKLVRDIPDGWFTGKVDTLPSENLFLKLDTVVMAFSSDRGVIKFNIAAVDDVLVRGYLEVSNVSMGFSI